MNAILREILGVAADLGQMFDALGVPWLIGGSVASSIRGEPRSTNDLDLVADLGTEHVQPLVWALMDVYYVDEDAVRAATLRRSCFNIIHLATMLKVDIFVPRRDATLNAQLARRQLVRIGDLVSGITLPLASAEDMVLQKIRWFEKGGGSSQQQWRDIMGMLKVQGDTLDRAYLLDQAEQMGIRLLLDQALQDGELPVSGQVRDTG